MKAFQFDDSGRFVGEVNCQESPLEPGVFLLPANSTTVAPERWKENETPYWTGEAWVIGPIEAKGVDVPLTEGGILESRKRESKGRIDAELQLRRKNGFSFNGVRYQADFGASESVSLRIQALHLGQVLEFPMPWRAADNTRPEFLSQSEFIEFAEVLRKFVSAIYTSAWNAKDSIDSAVTIEQVTKAYEEWGNS